MKASDVLALDRKVRESRFQLKTERRPLAVLAEQFGKELGFKVSINSLRDVLVANGIKTRGAGGKKDLQIEALTEENRKLRGLLEETAPHVANAPSLRSRVDEALGSTLREVVG